MKQRILIGIGAAIFVIGIVLSAVVLLSPSKDTVVIRRDGKTLYTFDLSHTPDQILTIPYGESSNTVEIKDGAIRVRDAACPDKTCVHMGWLRSSAMPIVCLPNHLVIEYQDSGQVDAVSE